MAKQVYGDSIDYQKVSIFGNPFSSRTLVTLAFANTVLMADPKTDFSQGTTLGQKGTFIHELAHIWQGQQGAFPTLRGFFLHTWTTIKGFSIGLFTKKTISDSIKEQRVNIYEGFVTKKTGRLGSFGLEEQATIIERTFTGEEKQKLRQPVEQIETKAIDILRNTTKEFPKREALD